MAVAWADMFARLRVDDSQVRKDVERGVGRADMTTAGRRAGQQFAGGYYRDVSGRLHRANGEFARESELAFGRAGGQAGRAFAGSAGRMMRGGPWRSHGLVIGKQVGSGAVAGIRPAAGALSKMLGGALATIGIGLGVESMIQQARAAQRAIRITDAVIKSTGGAAHVTAGEVTEMADSLSLATGVTRGTIRQGINMMLTFRGVRDAAGAGNDIFSQSIPLLLDMTAALGGGVVTEEALRKTAIRLGKALNDPILGMTALRRVGVTFTKQQTEMVKGWVAHGQILRAQKYILREIQAEFGNTARAAADPIQRLKALWAKFAAGVGGFLIRPLNAAISWVTETAIPAMQRWWGVASGRDVKTKLTGVPKFLSDAVTWIRNVGIPAAADYWRVLTHGGRPPPPPLPPQVRTGAGAPPQVQSLTATETILKRIHDWWVRIWSVVTSQAGPALSRLWAALKPGFTEWGHALSSVFGSLLMIWRAAAPFIGPLLKGALALIVLGFRAVAWTVDKVVAPVVRGLAVILSGFFTALSTALRNVPGWWTTMIGAVHLAWSRAVNFLRLLWDGGNGQGGLVGALRHAFAGFVDRVLGLIGFLIHGLANAFGWIPFGVGDSLRKADKAFQGFRDNVNKDILGINDQTVNVGVRMTAATNPWGIAGKQAAGGKVQGPGGPRDDRAGLYALSNREWVIQAASASRYGDPAMAAVNAGKAVISYAAGGKIGIPRTAARVPDPWQIHQTTQPAVRATAQKWAQKWVDSIGSIGNAIVAYARQFIGTRYVWGGTGPAGWDCSGFTGYVYRHFGYHPPRTSEQQYAWVRRTGDMPGALVFFVGAGGPPPGHVGISTGRGQMVNAAGTLVGTVVSGSGGNMGFGIPPGGFARGGKVRSMARGGVLREPVLGVGRSGQLYSLAENGPEPVGSDGIERRLDRLIDATERLADRTGRAVGAALDSVSGRAAHRAAWSPAGW